MPGRLLRPAEKTGLAMTNAITFETTSLQRKAGPGIATEQERFAPIKSKKKLLRKKN